MTVEDIRPIINRTTITAYRVFSIVTLYAVLAGVLVFAAASGFYATSSSWVAPVIVSPVDKDSLDFTGKLVASQATLDDLELDIAHLQKQVEEAQQHRAALEALRPELDAAIRREQLHKRRTGPQLISLDQQKVADNSSTREIVDKLAIVDAQVDKELTAGLITKTDAVQAKAQFVKVKGDLTDSRITALLLNDDILEKTTLSSTFLDVLNKRAELLSGIATLTITVDADQRQIASEKEQAARLRAVIQTASDSPLFTASTGGPVTLALVPYDNQAVAIVNTPVYDCYLSFVACHEVGRVRRIFPGEQHATHPIFRTDLRGFLMQIDLTEANSARSKTLFLGRKPLFF